MASSETTDVCVVGAGPAGLLLARCLNAAGARVTLVERGPLSKTLSPLPEEVHFEEGRYRGALDGRRFGLGGTSSVWGGQLIPMQPEDFTTCLDGQREPWPIKFEDLRDHYLKAWLALGLEESQHADCFACGERDMPALPGFVPRNSFAIAVKRRNFAHLWGAEMSASGNVDIVHGTLATAFESEGVGAERRIASVAVADASGHVRTIRAENFVVAAGALESTRLLLELQESMPKVPHALLGIGLQDHLSVRIASIAVRDRAAFNSAWSPWLRRGGIGFRRLEATTALQEELGVPSSFLHITYGSATSFPAALHDLAQKIQAGDPIQAGKAALRLSRYAGGAASLGLAYLVRRRIEWPADTPMTLLLDVEQLPDPRNRLSLGPRSSPGRRRPLAISWAVRDADAAAIQKFARRVFDQWQSEPSGNGVTITPLSLDDILASLRRNTSTFDVFHPIGTTRMSASSQDGVVDRDCRVYGYRNLYVASTSVFPRAGAANPTYTLLALAVRMAEHLGRNQAV